MAFRFFVQPAVAAFFALRDGIRDAGNQRPAYFWALFFHSGRRRELLRQGWRSVCGVYTLTVSIDLAYQAFVLRGFRPIQAAFVGVLLALFPYLVLRGPANRVARFTNKKAETPRRIA